MNQPSTHLTIAEKRRLLAGMPADDAELVSWEDRPFSIQQLSALLDTEIDKATADGGTVVVFRVRHRPFGIVEDHQDQFGLLRPELLEGLRDAHSGIKAVGSPRGEIIGFAPRLRRAADGMELLDELVRVMKRPIVIDGLSNLIGPRIGCAVLDDENKTAEDLLSATRLAVAKTSAGTVGAMFEPDQRDRQRSRLTMAEALHRAVVDRTLGTRYQPDVHLETGAVVAIKAYAHWIHDSRVVSNQELFETARRANLGLPIGRLVIEQALRETYGWITGGLMQDATLWVNVHPDEVLAPDFEKAMLNVIRYDERLRLGLELTENPVMDQDYIYGVLNQLRTEGAAVALGGFGTGYLNLASAHRLPFTAAKIDRSLTRQIAGSRASVKLVRAVADLAELFGLEVTAHGIETQDQAKRLMEIGCTIGQGFHYARPMSADDMKEALIQIKMGRRPF
ncbi:MAG: EAL domain-containing protein [Acidimicrobiales bacterium]|nr:EAL domain-containing protein [Acidimicrobiales bacterium]